MNKISALWIIPALVIGIIGAWLFFKFVYEPSATVSVSKRPNNDIVTLKLPNTGDAEIFGPKYWEAFHALAARIPCSICRDGAIPLEIFKHDIVNLKLGKKVFDKANWDTMVAVVNELNKQS